jgi:uncharacterized protein (TIGR03435 family)
VGNLPFFVSGVRGGHLARRIEAIAANRRASELTRARRATLLLGAITFGLAPVVVGALAIQSAAPQPSTADRPRFEVVSVKRTPEVTGPGADFTTLPGGRLWVRNNAVSNLVGNAYGGVPRYLIANMPDWVTSERYDLEAKAANPDATAPQLMLMLQTLLEERFRLKWHRETRQGPVYVLTVARGGHRLRGADDGACAGDLEQARKLPAPAPGRTSRVCGSSWLNSSGPNVVWSAYSIDIDHVARTLGSFTGRTVVNNTGITGLFDVDVELPRLQPLAGADFAPPDADAFTVIREQLGLVLEPGKGPLEYFVIDSIAKPPAN